LGEIFIAISPNWRFFFIFIWSPCKQYWPGWSRQCW